VIQTGLEATSQMARRASASRGGPGTVALACNTNRHGGLVSEIGITAVLNPCPVESIGHTEQQRCRPRELAHDLNIHCPPQSMSSPMTRISSISSSAGADQRFGLHFAERIASFCYFATFSLREALLGLRR